jgi:hypothetical protein
MDTNNYTITLYEFNGDVLTSNVYHLTKAEADAVAQAMNDRYVNEDNGRWVEVK